MSVGIFRIAGKISQNISCASSGSARCKGAERDRTGRVLFFGKSETSPTEQNQIYPALFVISNQLLEP
jgi:hypothetical protein